MKTVARAVLLALLLSTVGMMKSYAVEFDFAAVCSTGQTLYYRVTNSDTQEVQLTYPNYGEYSWEYGISSYIVIKYSNWYGYGKPSGDIIVPEHVEYNGVNYSVTSIRENTFGYRRGWY